MRKFIRHPTQVPIDIEVDETGLDNIDSTLLDISAGGLAFRVPRALSVGTKLTISLPDLWPDYHARGYVVWCHEFSGNYEAGIQFSEADEAFKARMVAQFCQIEDYKREMRLNEGRMLSSEEAAREWIGRYAEEFAQTVGWQ
jgi:c-di-GMP-binding flagellar brake protein YcgR